MPPGVTVTNGSFLPVLNAAVDAKYGRVLDILNTNSTAVFVPPIADFAAVSLDCAVITARTYVACGGRAPVAFTVIDGYRPDA